MILDNSRILSLLLIEWKYLHIPPLEAWGLFIEGHTSIVLLVFNFFPLNMESVFYHSFPQSKQFMKSFGSSGKEDRTHFL